MIIKKFQGNTKEEAIAQAREELGDQVVIMNIKEVRQGGMLGIFKKSTFEVTGAVEDGILQQPVAQETEPKAATRATAFSEGNGRNASRNTPARSAEPAIKRPLREDPPHNFSAAADETIKVPPMESPTLREEETADVLLDAIRAVDEARKNGVLQNGETKNPNIIPRENVREIPGSVTLKNSFEPVEQPDPGIYRKPAGTPMSHTQPIPRIENVKQPAPLPVEVPPEPLPQQNASISPVTVTEPEVPPVRTHDMNFVKMLYRVLLKNEIDERYINQLIEDMEKVISSGNSLDFMISNVYQKMVLTMGKTQTIEFTPGKKPKVVFLIGPTGVGKTTTIAKLAARHRINLDKRVALLTSDEYRLAAVDQLRKYAQIMNIPMTDISKSQDISIMEAIERYRDFDLIFVDTTGFSHRNEAQRQNVADLINSVDPQIDKEVYLVLSVTTKYKDLKEIIDAYKSFTSFNLIFTKLDESGAHGNILNCKLYSGADLSYVTTGQEVPRDIEVVDTQRMVKQFLGG